MIKNRLKIEQMKLSCEPYLSSIRMVVLWAVIMCCCCKEKDLESVGGIRIYGEKSQSIQYIEIRDTFYLYIDGGLLSALGLAVQCSARRQQRGRNRERGKQSMSCRWRG